MADEPIFDLYEPYPKAVIEGPRQAIIAALEETYFLTDTALELVGSALAAVDELVAANSALNIRLDAALINQRTAFDAIDDLQRRVAALEPPPEPEPEPDEPQPEDPPADPEPPTEPAPDVPPTDQPTPEVAP